MMNILNILVSIYKNLKSLLSSYKIVSFHDNKVYKKLKISVPMSSPDW